MKTIIAFTLLIWFAQLAAAEKVDQSRFIDLIQRSSAIVHVRVTFTEGKSATQKIVQKVSIIDTWKKERDFTGDMSFKIACSEFSPGKSFSLGSRLTRDFIVFSGFIKGDFSGYEPGSWCQHLSVDGGQLWIFDHYLPLEDAKTIVTKNAG
jgi:hypothetical protein